MFDFAKVNIKPSQILRKVSYTIQKSLTKDQVNDIKQRFVSEDIFSEGEAESCKDSSSLLETLRRRGEEQIGDALNIICEDSTNKQVINAIEDEMSKQKIKVTQSAAPIVNQATSLSPANQMEELVTVDNSRRVAKVLIKDPNMSGKWTNLATYLGLENHEIQRLKQDYRDKTISFEDLLTEIVNTWCTLLGEQATFVAFCKILSDEKFIMCRDGIKKEFSAMK